MKMIYNMRPGMRKILMVSVCFVIIMSFSCGSGNKEPVKDPDVTAQTGNEASYVLYGRFEISVRYDRRVYMGFRKVEKGYLKTYLDFFGDLNIKMDPCGDKSVSKFPGLIKIYEDHSVHLIFIKYNSESRDFADIKTCYIPGNIKSFEVMEFKNAAEARYEFDDDSSSLIFSLQKQFWISGRHR